jgi:hypothetical protein
LIDNAESRAFRAALPPFCAPCPQRDACRGGCLAAAEWVFGSRGELDPFLAQHVMPDYTTRVVGQSTPPAGAQRVVDANVAIDPWFDLLYHVLAHLPISPADASSLYDAQYVAWIDQQFGYNARSRTLSGDAELMAGLYDACDRAFVLHAGPTLWRDAADFLSRVDATPEALADVHPVLVDLLRTSLWNELRSGFEMVWQQALLPRALAYRQRFAAQMNQVAMELPGLRGVQWMLCCPLGPHGRALSSEGRPVIAVGVADVQSALLPMHPIIQGCHEWFVEDVQSRKPRRWSTVRGGDGYAAFRQTEEAALERGRRFFAATRWAQDYDAWRSTLAPAART